MHVCKCMTAARSQPPLPLHGEQEIVTVAKENN